MLNFYSGLLEFSFFNFFSFRFLVLRLIEACCVIKWKTSVCFNFNFHCMASDEIKNNKIPIISVSFTGILMLIFIMFQSFVVIEHQYQLQILKLPFCTNVFPKVYAEGLFVRKFHEFLINLCRGFIWLEVIRTRGFSGFWRSTEWSPLISISAKTLLCTHRRKLKTCSSG